MALDLKKSLNGNSPWLMRYVVVIETTILISIGGFFLTGYHNLVTKDELNTTMARIIFPYPQDKPMIDLHIKNSEKLMDKLVESLHNLDSRIQSETHANDLRITLLEKQLEKKQ